MKIRVSRSLDSLSVPGVARYYYFMVDGDPVPDDDQGHIDTIDITGYLMQIVASLKALCPLGQDESTALDAIMQRFRAVSEAA